jgi:hypothetical protein
MNVTEMMVRMQRRVEDLEAAGADAGTDDLEPLITEGSAHALDLEARRSRLSRSIRELAERAHEEDAARALRRRSRELQVTERNLERLRRLLEELEDRRAAGHSPPFAR